MPHQSDVDRSKPYEQCPRYRHCSVNRCPLDPAHELRTHLTGEPSCTLSKSTRLRIGSQHEDVLPMRGLTGREYSAAARWDALTEDQRQAISERASSALTTYCGGD